MILVTPESAARFFARPPMAEAAYRAGARRLHPDRGGDPEQFARLTRSIEFIREHWANQA